MKFLLFALLLITLDISTNILIWTLSIVIYLLIEFFDFYLSIYLLQIIKNGLHVPMAILVIDTVAVLVLILVYRYPFTALNLFIFLEVKL